MVIVLLIMRIILIGFLCGCVEDEGLVLRGWFVMIFIFELFVVFLYGFVLCGM